MKTKILSAAVIALVISACNTQNDTTVQNEGTPAVGSENTTAAPVAQKGKYVSKSGIVTYETETMGMKGISTLYYDDFGNKEATETESEMEMMGTKASMHNIVINKEGFSYDIDLNEKTGTKTQLITGSSTTNNMDFSAMTDDMMQKMHVKKEGSQDFLGKKCDIYTMDDKGSQMKGKYYIYNNIPLKMDMTMGGMEIKMIATKFEDNVNVPASKFDIPANIKFTEM
ncbi:MAG: hypothetical protein H0X46_06485 [Bacteroidetes bacterium]|nr:hypothetical protein [Bacteroidota bacterium]